MSQDADYAPLMEEKWYCWRVAIHFDDEPGPRLIIPRSDPDTYEYPADGLFRTLAEAIEWREDELASLDDANQRDEIQYVQSWKLVRLTMTEIPLKEAQIDSSGTEAS